MSQWLMHSSGFWKEHKYTGKHKSKKGNTVYEYGNKLAEEADKKVIEKSVGAIANNVGDLASHTLGYLKNANSSSLIDRGQAAINAALMKEDIAVIKLSANVAAWHTKDLVLRKVESGKKFINKLLNK